MKSAGKLCDLCQEEAFVYCLADAAFLCWQCDDKVHQANFLVARHLRNILCTNCKSSFCQKPIWGPPSHLMFQTTHLCKPCSSHNTNLMASSTLSSSSSDCLSTNESSSTDFEPKRILVRSRSTKPSHSSSPSVSEVPNTNNKLEGVFAVWCKKLAVNRQSVVPTATSALQLCLERLAALPFRVSLAAAFWVGLRMSGDRSLASWQNLKRLEELSGVPAKLIVAVEPRVARVMRLRRRISQDLEEGWAECNV
ncbi:hypothetical protein QUC31_012032 [Theobroma cacao]